MNFKYLLVIFFLSQTSRLFAQQDSTATGRKIFQTHCGSCHSVHAEIIGPALASITKKRDRNWLISFIKNSQQVIASGDAYAKFLAEQYNHMVMPSFSFSDDEIQNILYYIEKESVRPGREFKEIESIDVNYENPDVLRGRDLFRDQCATCHAIDRESYGPALGSVPKRRPHSWLTKFIRNSQAVIKTGDPYAVFLFEKFERKIMVPMEFLSENEIQDILRYIEFTSVHQSPNKKSNKENRSSLPTRSNYTESKTGNSFSKVFFITLASFGFAVISFLVFNLYRYLNQ